MILKSRINQNVGMKAKNQNLTHQPKQTDFTPTGGVKFAEMPKKNGKMPNQIWGRMAQVCRKISYLSHSITPSYSPYKWERYGK